MSMESVHIPPLRGVTLQALIAMRREPAESAEMVSQLLFGELYRVEETLEKWLRIVTLFDNYEGWIDRKLFAEPASLYAETSDAAVQFALIAEIGLPDGSRLMTAAGSSLPGFDPAGETIFVHNTHCRIFSLYGPVTCPVVQKITETARQFMHAPYVWGGRSPFGFDCSGFVQTVFHIHCLSLPRDAAQQFETGKAISSLREAEAGDLAFFAGDSGRINHVGLLDGEGRIIHCSGQVRVDPIDEDGIRHAAKGVLTHHLAGIRRIKG